MTIPDYGGEFSPRWRAQYLNNSNIGSLDMSSTSLLSNDTIRQKNYYITNSEIIFM